MKSHFLLGAFLCSFILIAGCKTTENDSPKTVLSKFFDAMAKEDFVEAKKYITKDSEGVMGMVEMGNKSKSDTTKNMFSKDKIKLGNEVINGDRAEVTVTEIENGESNNFILKKENNMWKVAFDKSTLMEMAKKKMKEKGLDRPKVDSSVILKNPTAKDLERMLDSAHSSLDRIQRSIK